MFWRLYYHGIFATSGPWNLQWLAPTASYKPLGVLTIYSWILRILVSCFWQISGFRGVWWQRQALMAWHLPSPDLPLSNQPDGALPQKIHSLLLENDPILATEEYFGPTPLHLGLEFVQANDEAVSGTVDEGNMVFIFTPTKMAYEIHEDSNEGSVDWVENIEEDEGGNNEQKGSTSRQKRRFQTQLCINDWLLKNGARGRTAKLSSGIQIL